MGHAYREVLQLLVLRLLMVTCKINDFDLLRIWLLKVNFTKERVYLAQEILSGLTPSYAVMQFQKFIDKHRLEIPPCTFQVKTFSFQCFARSQQNILVHSV